MEAAVFNPFRRQPRADNNHTTPGASSRSGEIDLVAQVAESLADPIPADQPDAAACPIPSGASAWALDATTVSANAGFHEVLRKAQESAEQHAAEQDRTSSDAEDSQERLTAVRNEEVMLRGKRTVVHSLLAGRIHRGKLTARKALILMLLIALGEVTLNASAAIYEGDPTLLSLAAFSGIGAATVAVGWLGAVLHQHVERGRHPGPPPPEATTHHLEHFWGAGGPRALVSVTALVLAVTAAALGIGIAVMRALAGSSAIYGMFTVVVVIGATAVAYMADDPVTDLLHSLDQRLALLRSEAAHCSRIIGVHREAGSRREAAMRTGLLAAYAQWYVTLATGLHALAHQTAIVGHYHAQTLPSPPPVPKAMPELWTNAGPVLPTGSDSSSPAQTTAATEADPVGEVAPSATADPTPHADEDTVDDADLTPPNFDNFEVTATAPPNGRGS
jgi:hypothetical protein